MHQIFEATVATTEQVVQALRQQGVWFLDTTRVKAELATARMILEQKGAPLEGTAAGHLILALEALVKDLDNSLGYTHRDGEIDDVLRQHRRRGSVSR